MSRYFSLKFIIFISCAIVVIARSDDPRCFHYTWLGPKWNNESSFLNLRCEDVVNDARGMPCVRPLIVSENGTWPYTDYIWKYYKKNASCILADDEVCATYTIYFDGVVLNSTSFCTKAVDENRNAVKDGCYTSTNGSFATTACFCRSLPGIKPCNNAHTHFVPSSIFIIAICLLINLNYDGW